MITERIERLALCRSMKNMAETLTGLDVAVMDCSGGSAVAYSSLKNGHAKICINFGFQFHGLGADEKRCIFYGLFAHEVMHLLRTDFTVLAQLQAYKAAERKDRKDVANICEDPAIEFRSREHLSGFLCGCLEKTIEYFYREAPDIQDGGSDAYLQYVTAMIQFGDMGILKGDFSFSDAYDAFIVTAPKMLRLIEEPDARARFAMSQEIFEDIRPIWEEHNKSAYANSDANDLLGSMGVTESSGDGSGPGSSGSSPGQQGDGSNDGQAAQNRRELVSAIKESLGKNTMDAATEHVQDAGSAINGKESAETQEAMDPSGAMGLTDDGHPFAGKTPESLRRLMEKNAAETGLGKPFAVSQELTEASERLVNEAKEQIAREERKAAERAEKDRTDPPVRSPYYGESRYEVYKICTGDMDAYEDIAGRLRPDIANFRSLLKKIFRGAYIKKAYKTSGKLNIPRCCGKKMTARVFERRYDPGDKTDLAVAIMVDQSGSMERNMQSVKDTLILILEAMKPFDIPVKVVGFTTLCKNYDADYFHYGSWKNTQDMRTSIISMEANGGTFLGHAIRYGAELLKARPERKKIYIVITDGEPCHQRYATRQNGIDDCKRAVAEISKTADVIGIGIYEPKNEEFGGIFKEKTAVLGDTSELIHTLPKLIARSLKN